MKLGRHYHQAGYVKVNTSLRSSLALCHCLQMQRNIISNPPFIFLKAAENSNKNLNFPMRCTVLTILHDHDVINNVLFSFAQLLQCNYCTTVTLVHQDYLDTINVSVLYVITGSIFI